MIDADAVLAHLLARARARNPKSRATDILRLVRNTGSTKQLGCVLCGEESNTWCAKWPTPKGVLKWAHAHRAYHVEHADELHVAWDREEEGDRNV